MLFHTQKLMLNSLDSHKLFSNKSLREQLQPAERFSIISDTLLLSLYSY